MSLFFPPPEVRPLFFIYGPATTSGTESPSHNSARTKWSERVESIRQQASSGDEASGSLGGGESPTRRLVVRQVIVAAATTQYGRKSVAPTRRVTRSSWSPHAEKHTWESRTTGTKFLSRSGFVDVIFSILLYSLCLFLGFFFFISIGLQPSRVELSVFWSLTLKDARGKKKKKKNPIMGSLMEERLAVISSQRS